MQIAPPPEERPRANAPKAARAPLTLRLDRVAGDLNPFLILLVVGLLLLDLTLYIGLAVSRQQSNWNAPHQAETSSPPASPRR